MHIIIKNDIIYFIQKYFVHRNLEKFEWITKYMVSVNSWKNLLQNREKIYYEIYDFDILFQCIYYAQLYILKLNKINK